MPTILTPSMPLENIRKHAFAELERPMTVTEPARGVERLVSGRPDAWVRRSLFRRRKPGLSDGLMGVALLAGPANVIMQLSQPGVGYGVMESRVESGRVDRH